MIVEISAVPIGVGDSLSGYIAEVVGVLDRKGIKYQLTPMGTIIEIDSYDELSALLKEFDKALFGKGSPRNYYVIKIDHRVKKTSMEHKVESVLEKLK
jgi:uncharacterized protein (TIGR00106 family)